MASRLIAFIAIQGILLQTAYTQCINRVVPTMGPNVVETILPNQVLYREPGLPILPTPCGGQILPPIYQTPIISGPIGPVVSEVGYPTVMQDSSVANSLANALQLLVVSNLLSTTLPTPCEMPLYPYEVMGMPAYNYIYMLDNSRIYINKSLDIKLQLLCSHWTNMARRLVLVILTEFLITKVTPSYVQRYSPSPYVVRDPRSSNPYQDYQSYYARYATQAAQPTYQRSTQAPRPVQYRQPSYPRPPAPLPPTVPRPMEFRPPYPTQIAAPTIPSPVIGMEYRSPRYQKSAEFVPPVVPTQKPVEYRIPYQKPGEYIIPAIQTVDYRQPFQQVTEYVAPPFQSMEYPYQKAVELLTPTIQSAVEYQSPTYQKTSELIPPTIHIPSDYEPGYQKVVEFIANQKPIETQQSTCLTDLTSNLQSSEIPTSLLDSLQSLALSKSDCLPKTSSRALDTDVINNLAIALQLLIVNNIINHPRSESTESMSNLSDSILELVYPTELPASNPYNLQSPCEMCNAKFLGSSNFGDDGIISKGMLGLGSYGTGSPLSRSGFNLMSPYDAIAASSSLSDPSPSAFTLKSNFQSPYAAMMAADNNKDLFSMSDLF
ncbi:uncharacterized protein LOC123878941 [Maniola jurtina]|uniref:uncharacterized protein LOC123878941 n=1 Tax=Maniola jurtina TaxID=191418 RepID=UPI001E68F687|nr:uncharacterized protein LOC123878941 [Maniola jurtina]